MQILGKFFVVLVRAYQICLSPFLLPCCRFYPSCSEFAIDAIRRHGPLKGSGLALLRLLRCHPWHPGGYDPVK
ncbi:MAG: membrane protein insertion efficiency factor YidD [Syntrophales bacterium]|nr:membrane protein insertion efficiency factor YidD [Syntrophales bacterium]